MRFSWSFAALFFLAAPHAYADDEPTKHAEQPEKPEIDAFPLAGGDSDIGFGLGALAAVTKLDEARKPYLWRLEAGLLATFKPPSGGRPFRFPYQDYYVVLTLPHLASDRVRFELRPSFTWETTDRYYGIGNASQAPSPGGPSDPNDPYYQYGRAHATIQARAKLRLDRGTSTAGVFIPVGISYTQNWLDVRDASALARDHTSGSDVVRSIVDAPRPHGVLFFEYGVEWDARDDEISTHSGTWDQIKVRLSPGVPGTDLPYRYVQLDAIARGYVPIGKRVVVAGRAVLDVQTDDPPFYELARYEDTFALGGSNGVRGVPGQRYYGKVKTFGNLEVRTMLVDFHALSKEWSLATVGFFDAGRAWTELGRAHPDLDGTGLGLKFGVGAGIRLHQGKAFVVRGDLAWSPDATPIGGYFAAGEVF